MTIGEVIKKRRLELGLTQEELGKKVGVQKSAIAKYENGRVSNMKRPVVKGLCTALGISPQELLCMEAEPIDRLESIYNQLSKDKQDDLLNYAEYLLSKK